MKAKKISTVRSKVDYEAPLFNASVPIGKLTHTNSQKMYNLNELLKTKPEGMYLVKVNGESMIDENIFDGDILVVDSTELPKSGKVVIASVNGELLVKTYKVIDRKVYLFSANKKFLPLEIMSFYDFAIQGVVKHVIHILGR